jgi:hypothetical protein
MIVLPGMNTLSVSFVFLAALALFTGSDTAVAQEAELIPMRDWTSDDGKVLRASLVGFEKGQGQFRTPEGRRFVIGDERLSMRDRVAILTARMNSQLELSYSADINTDFYYSKHIPASRRWEKAYSFLGFGPGRFNLGIALIEPSLDASPYKEVVVRGSGGAPDAVYVLRESDIRRYTRDGKEHAYARLSLPCAEDEAVLKTIEDGLTADSLTFVARGGGAAEHVYELDEPERNGLRETVAIYRQATKLIAEGFLKRARLADQTAEATGQNAVAATANVANAARPVAGDPLEPFRKGLAQSKYGTLQWGADAVDGVGFLGAEVVVRRRDGELARAPFAEFSEAGRQHLFEKRLEEAFGKARHEYSAGVTVFLHPDWDSQRMSYSRSILLTRNSDGNYALRLFAWVANTNLTPVKEVFLRGDQQERPFVVGCRAGESYTRERTDGALNTLVGTYLNDEDSGKVRALQGSRSIQLRVRSDQNQDVSVTMQEDELNVTLEAIALFQWARQL